MSKKVIKIVLIILLIAIALEVVFVLVDKEKVKQNQEPVFTRVTNVYISDSPISGYEEYLGLGYKILKVKITENEYYTKMMPIWEESDLSEALKMIEENNSKNKDNYGYTKLEKLPEEYPVHQAKEDGCVIIVYNEIKNKEKLDNFIVNTEINAKERKSDKIRIIQFTAEGDMIIEDLEYNAKNEEYILTTDNTRDKFSAEEDRKITVNEDIPGNFYGITKTEENGIITIKLNLYAEILYQNEMPSCLLQESALPHPAHS